MSLKRLTDPELIASTKNALNLVREAETDVLRHFREIEDRNLWTEAGTLYAFLERTFSLTADQVYPRLQAMRLMRVVPELEQKLEAGQLSVTNVLKAHQVFKAESKQRQVTLDEKRDVLESLENTSTKEADKVLAERYPDSKKPIEKVKPVAPNQNLIQFYVDDETLNQIEELKAKFSHQIPSGKMEDLMKILIRQANRPAKPKKKSASVRKRSRYIPADVKRDMEKSRHQGCIYIDVSTGEKCGSKHFLQMDHIHEFSRGGVNDFQNLQWLCGFHNRHRFETGRSASGCEGLSK